MSETTSAAISEHQGTLTTQQVVELTKKFNYGTWRFQKTWNPMHIADAEGCYFTDGAGKRYLDLSAQLMCVNLGHKNPAVIRAIAEQAEALAYASPAYATEARAELSQLLLDVLPGGLTKFFFTTSGRRRTRRRSRLHGCIPARRRLLRGTGRITGRRWRRLRRRAIHGAGRWSRWAGRGRVSCSRQR